MDDLIQNKDGSLKLYGVLQEHFLPKKDLALIRRRPPQKNLYPSSASAVVIDPITGLETAMGTCMRKAWYSNLGYQEDDGEEISPRSIKVMHIGEPLAREFLYNPIKDVGLYAAEELEFYDESIHVSGRLDLIAYIPGTNEKCIVECKSMSPNMCTPFVKTGLGFSQREPRYYDLCQLMTYMQYYKKYDINYGAMYYITRDLDDSMFFFKWAHVADSVKEIKDEDYLICYTGEREYHLSFLTWGKIKQRYLALWDHIQKNEMPPRDYALAYSNDYLEFLAKNAGKGSQFIDMPQGVAKDVLSKLDPDKIKKSRSKKDPSEPVVDRGSFACSYCPYKNRCWFGLTPKPKTYEKKSPLSGIKPMEKPKPVEDGPPVWEM